MAKKRCKWMDLDESVTVGRAASTQHWSELTIWMLIQQKHIRSAVRGFSVIVSLVEVRHWADRNKRLAQELKGVIGNTQTHPIASTWKK